MPTYRPSDLLSRQFRKLGDRMCPSRCLSGIDSLTKCSISALSCSQAERAVSLKVKGVPCRVYPAVRLFRRSPSHRQRGLHLRIPHSRELPDVQSRPCRQGSSSRSAPTAQRRPTSTRVGPYRISRLVSEHGERAMKPTILRVLNTVFIVGGARRRYSRPGAGRGRHSHWQTATEPWSSRQEIGRQLYDKADFQRACQAFLGTLSVVGVSRWQIRQCLLR